MRGDDGMSLSGISSFNKWIVASLLFTATTCWADSSQVTNVILNSIRGEKILSEHLETLDNQTSIMLIIVTPSGEKRYIIAQDKVKEVMVALNSSNASIQLADAQKAADANPPPQITHYYRGPQAVLPNRMILPNAPVQTNVVSPNAPAMASRAALSANQLASK
jgi:hypothetical protein